MRKNISNSVIAGLAGIALMAGCKPKQILVEQAPQAVVVPAPDNKAERLESIKNAQLQFKTLSLRAKAALDIGGNSNDVTMNIRMRSNESIWISVTALAGLEVARALITPDSVKIINRLESVYMKKPFSFVREYSNEKLTFATLQSILTGNLDNNLVNPDTELTAGENNLALKSIFGTLVYDALLNPANKVSRSSLKDSSKGQSLNADYSAFQVAGSGQLPGKVALRSIANKKNIRVDMEYSRVELNVDVDMPFRVPDRFTIKN